LVDASNFHMEFGETGIKPEVKNFMLSRMDSE
jgi:hypothetical protein